MAKRGLGRGLDALIPKVEVKENKNDNKIINLDIDQIITGHHQPRQDFDEEKLQELAQSIRVHGVIQPIVVKPIGDNSYEIVAGERRWRASKKAGLDSIPAIIKEIDERETAEIALIENLQREDLNPIEEAEAYRELINKYKLKQDEIAKRVGKSRPVIANALRLLNLPTEVKTLLKNNQISQGHARLLLSLQNSDQQRLITNKIIKEKLSVRDTEKAIKKLLKSQKETHKDKKEKPSKKDDLEIKFFEDQLQQSLSTKVKLRHNKKNGKIEIYYFGYEDLERILSILIK
ncbi:MAG: ParB family transcriptional regulator, chromosome partitioning protein [Clostridia bacterium]|nr:ParB family transcriptional regulator, chromosome partitioning protein [Clostridia bacterium]